MNIRQDTGVENFLAELSALCEKHNVNVQGNFGIYYGPHDDGEWHEDKWVNFIHLTATPRSSYCDDEHGEHYRADCPDDE